MAVVLIEGFDHIVRADLPLKGWSGSIGDAMVAGRFGGQALRSQSTSGPTKALPSSYQTLFMGRAFRISAIPSSTKDIKTFQVGATKACRVGVTSSGLLVVRNAAGTVIATGTTPLLANVFYYIETKVFVNGSSGTCEVHLNGVSGEIASTGGDFGSSNIDTIGIDVDSGAESKDCDDVYVADTAGAAPRNTFLGDVRVSALYPTGAGAHAAWTPDSGSNYARVNEALADGDTSYVSSSTPGSIDTSAFADMDAAAAVAAVQRNLYARKDDAGVRQIAPVIRQSGNDYVGSTVTLASSYALYSQIYNQDPLGADWTPTTVNANENGFKEIA